MYQIWYIYASFRTIGELKAVSKNKQIGSSLAILITISIFFLLGKDSSTYTASIAENNSAPSTQVEPTTTSEEPHLKTDTSTVETSKEQLAKDNDITANKTEVGKVELMPEDKTKPATPNSFDALIAQLRVEPEFIEGYSRSLFRHWVDESGNGCDTRQEVLIGESLTPVTISSGCAISGGSWFSNFDGITTTEASRLDIDHFVPLSEAWRSGAHAWSSTIRRSFANDLGYEHSLIAVTASSNRSKGDKDPASWLPSRANYHCEYIYKWVNVKIRWSLSVDSAELDKISSIASSCSIETLRLNPSTNVFSEVKVGPTLQPQIDVTTDESTTCTDQQVDVNYASVEELLRIIHIGDVRAAELIQLRPFTSLDELGRINGIASSRLSDIKSQGIACVGS